MAAAAPDAFTRALQRRRKREEIAVIGTVVAVAVVVSAVGLFLALVPRTGPGLLAIEVGQATEVSPGSAGCRATSNELCYQMPATAMTNGIQLGNIHFTLSNASYGVSGPFSSPFPVGPGAGLTVLDELGETVGVWNWSLSDWTYGAGWGFSLNTTVSLVFDTGLLNSAYLPYLILWLGTTSPFASWSSVTLHWAEPSDS
jgi:hypothetical protein